MLTNTHVIKLMEKIAGTMNSLKLNENNIRDIQSGILVTMKWTGNFECGKLYSRIPEENQLCNIITNEIGVSGLCDHDII